LTGTLDLENVSNASQGTLNGSWPANRPSIVRAQVINLNGDTGGFSLADLDGNGVISYSRSLFLYPTTAGSSNLDFSSDNRKIDTNNDPSYVTCSAAIMGSSSYACRVDISLPSFVSPNDNAFLRIASINSKSNYRVTLFNGAAVVNFDGVQPEIDSTGRADNLFRRVKARVGVSNVNFPYPEAAVDVTGNLCKNFWVTNTNYSTSCTP